MSFPSGSGTPPASAGELPPDGPLDRASVVLACVGGLILVALTVVVTASVLGRWLVGREIPGAFELVQVGVAIAAFLFLPICQIRGQNITVDSFTAWTSPRIRAALDALWALLYATVALVLAWRLSIGAVETIGNHMVTSMLQLPFGWAMLVGAAALLFLAFVSTVVAWRHLRARSR